MRGSSGARPDNGRAYRDRPRSEGGARLLPLSVGAGAVPLDVEAPIVTDGMRLPRAEPDALRDRSGGKGKPRLQ